MINMNDETLLQSRSNVQNLSINISRIYEDNEENKAFKLVRLTHYANERLYVQSVYEMTLVATGKTYRENLKKKFDSCAFNL